MIEQIAKELDCKPEWITKLEIDEKSHRVSFMVIGSWYWAKLSKNNKNILKNSIRLDNT